MTSWQALQDKWRFLDSEFIHHKTHVGQLALFKEVGGPTIVQCSDHRSATHNNGEDLFVRYMLIIAPLALHFFGPAYLYNYRSLSLLLPFIFLVLPICTIIAAFSALVFGL